MQKKQSFYQFVIKQITKNSLNRMNLPTFTKVLRKKAQQVSSTQLLFVYKELQRIKQKNSQFQSQNQANSFQNLPYNPKPVMKIQSYEKHALICLQQIAIKFKQKNGYEQGFDLCKLLYYRLLNAISYNLPHNHILQQFNEQFLWRDLGGSVMEYIELIEKDPQSLGQVYIDTVNQIINCVVQELQQVNVLQLPYLKSVLSKGKTYNAYSIKQQLMQKIDDLIYQNRYAYSFKELELALNSNNKHSQTYALLSLMSKDVMDKRLNYLLVDELSFTLQPSLKQNQELRCQLGLPGKQIDQDSFQLPFKKISELNLFNVYIDLFPKTHQKKEITKTLTAKNYINFHFTYFIKSGTITFPIQKITSTLNNTFQSSPKMTTKGIKFQHLDILQLFIILQTLSRQKVSSAQVHEIHSNLQNQLQSLNLIHKPKFQEFNKIFQKSTQAYQRKVQADSFPCKKSLHEFIGKTDSKIIDEMIVLEWSRFSSYEKKIIINELILSLITSIIKKNSNKESVIFGKVLQSVAKLQYRKFSTEFANIQKILNLIQKRL